MGRGGGSRGWQEAVGVGLFSRRFTRIYADSVRSAFGISRKAIGAGSDDELLAETAVDKLAEFLWGAVVEVPAASKQ